MTANDNAMATAFRRAAADIASLADWIELALEKHEDDETTWASVQTLEHTREQLINVLAEFSGVETAEIQRSLDELHS